MIAIIRALFSSLRQGLKSRAALHAEIVALHHQLLVLQRGKGSRKLRLSVADRLLWTWLSQLWSGWRSVLVMVKPETVIAWHRRGFRLYWSWKSRHSQCRRLRAEYIRYYHEDRTHLGLAKDTPAGRPVESRSAVGSRIHSLPRLGGLHHTTSRHSSRAANPPCFTLPWPTCARR
jgi:hypothetical protein